MTYQPCFDMFAPGAVSLDEKLRRLRGEITAAQDYQRRLEAAFDHFFGNGHSPLYWRIEKAMVARRILEMESQLSQMLRRYGD